MAILTMTADPNKLDKMLEDFNTEVEQDNIPDAEKEIINNELVVKGRLIHMFDIIDEFPKRYLAYMRLHYNANDIAEPQLIKE